MPGECATLDLLDRTVLELAAQGTGASPQPHHPVVALVRGLGLELASAGAAMPDVASVDALLMPCP